MEVRLERERERSKFLVFELSRLTFMRRRRIEARKKVNTSRKASNLFLIFPSLLMKRREKKQSEIRRIHLFGRLRSVKVLDFFFFSRHHHRKKVNLNMKRETSEDIIIFLF